MERPIQSKQVVAEFFGHGYRVSGAFLITKRPLADVVYDPTTDLLELRDAYLSPVTDPATICSYFSSTLFNKNHIDFILTAEQKDGLRRDQLYNLGRYKFNVSLTVPFFEITGQIHSAMMSFMPRNYLSGEAGAFITLLDVTARCTFNPNAVYRGAVALVSRERISFLGQRTE